MISIVQEPLTTKGTKFAQKTVESLRALSGKSRGTGGYCFFAALQNELTPNHPKVSVNVTTAARCPALVCRA